jgi:hypothetical protein
MIPTVVVNMLTVVHKASDGIATSGPPDVCWTPTPLGPIAIPYVNTAFSKDLVKGSESVTADGQTIALKDSEFATSIGDEPGTVGGIVSGVNKGKAKFSNYSMDVKIESRNVCRLSDPMLLNGNAPNTTNPAEIQGNIGSELFDLLCRMFCWCDQDGNTGGDFVDVFGEGTRA